MQIGVLLNETDVQVTHGMCTNAALNDAGWQEEEEKIKKINKNFEFWLVSFLLILWTFWRFVP